MQMPDMPEQGQNMEEQPPDQMSPVMQVPVMPMQTGFPMLAPVAPVVTQPQQQPNANIMFDVQSIQPMPFGIPTRTFGPLQWSTGLFQCCADIPMCLFGSICPICLPCYLSSLFGEVCCLGFLPGAMFSLRTGLREQHKISGTLLTDYCAICCCLLCAMCQMSRQMKGRPRQHTRFPMPRIPLFINRGR